SAPSTYEVHHNSSHIHPWRSPKKRLIPVDPQTASMVATSLLENTSLRYPLWDTELHVNMEFPSWIKDLGSKKIAQMPAENEGDMWLGRISGEALLDWEWQNPEVLADENIRYKYNFLSENLIIECMLEYRYVANYILCLISFS